MLAGRGTEEAIVPLARHLWHEYPLLRLLATRAIERLTGAPVPVDADAPADEVRPAVRSWLSAAGIAFQRP